MAPPRLGSSAGGTCARIAPRGQAHRRTSEAIRPRRPGEPRRSRERLSCQRLRAERATVAEHAAVTGPAAVAGSVRRRGGTSKEQRGEQRDRAESRHGKDRTTLWPRLGQAVRSPKGLRQEREPDFRDRRRGADYGRRLSLWTATGVTLERGGSCCRSSDLDRRFLLRSLLWAVVCSCSTRGGSDAATNRGGRETPRWWAVTTRAMATPGSPRPGPRPAPAPLDRAGGAGRDSAGAGGAAGAGGSAQGAGGAVPDGGAVLK